MFSGFFSEIITLGQQFHSLCKLLYEKSQIQSRIQIRTDYCILDPNQTELKSSCSGFTRLMINILLIVISRVGCWVLFDPMLAIILPWCTTQQFHGSGSVFGSEFLLFYQTFKKNKVQSSVFYSFKSQCFGRIRICIHLVTSMRNRWARIQGVKAMQCGSRSRSWSEFSSDVGFSYKKTYLRM
jgi:hypothetical protein